MNKSDEPTTKQLCILFIMVVAIVILSLCPKRVHSCNYERTKTVDASREQLFPHTWRCKGCGYENYDGIKYCAICGRKR